MYRNAVVTISKKFVRGLLPSQGPQRPTDRYSKPKPKRLRDGGAGESKMTAHQAKKLDLDNLLAFRDRFSPANRRAGSEARICETVT